LGGCTSKGGHHGRQSWTIAKLRGQDSQAPARIGRSRPLPALRDALSATDVRHQLTVYPGADHAFHTDTGHRYDEAQATAAWNDTLAWFTRYV
jgi:dienelactone hydrolase